MGGSLNRKIINFPNLLSLIRIILTPVMVYALFKGHALMALCIFAIAGFTDALDGFWARHFNQFTRIGAYLDPIADKILLISAFCTLFLLEYVPLYLFLAVIFRDAIILMGALIYELVTHKLEIMPTLLSKATTLMQIAYVLIIIGNMLFPLPDLLIFSSLLLTFTLTCTSGIHYMILWTIMGQNNSE
ncbi:MAG: CDP-alcohol phosphatidyltransferase family protein [Mariprofundales bacterium]